MLQLVGAGGFGAFMGWQTYFVNRYRTDAVKLTDLASLVAVLAGGGVLAVFPSGSDLFGAYGVGLCLGFAAYLIVLLILVSRSAHFDRDWFLDGRRERPGDDQICDGVRQTSAPMERPEPQPAPIRSGVLERGRTPAAEVATGQAGMVGHE